MSLVIETSVLTESDRADREVLARGHHGHFGEEVDDDGYERTWRRLLDDGPVRGILARLDGRVVAVAHHVFHAGVWSDDRCYLADLFVVPEARRRGVATAMIERVARDAEEHGFPRLYWNALEDSPARELYDRVADCRGLVVHSYRRDAHRD
ncbi:GNAT family N-acetyltransferase [Umezawaea beigongshangensis]|uniref:GNAT family N-acetyltransferase n=1 Tax=Umezawaea beigongshangensis TaxID=2780383 RepID=UPI0018F22A92|nr:GNAT family N-acetyltransferase [Umezawaea beigongshangensis]